jgi:protein-S-isoprenylcysteine O-methyltransferase Ste14
MQKLMAVFLSFTHKSYSPAYKILSMIPGSVVFLVISPLFLLYFSSYISQFIPIAWPRTLEVAMAGAALAMAFILMLWGFLSLWVDGKGTPAPITPTKILVTTGPYQYCRNPIEVGTDLYFLFLGTWVDGLTTGILCMCMGMLLGYGYIKTIEERELNLRFGLPYKEYLEGTPLFLPTLFSRRQKKP